MRAREGVSVSARVCSIVRSFVHSFIFFSQYIHVPAVFFIRALHTLNNQTDRHSVCVCVCVCVCVRVCVRGYSETFTNYFFFDIS